MDCLSAESDPVGGVVDPCRCREVASASEGLAVAPRRADRKEAAVAYTRDEAAVEI